MRMNRGRADTHMIEHLADDLADQFGPQPIHHSVLTNRRFPSRHRIGRLCGDFRHRQGRIFVSAGVRRLWCSFGRPCLRIQKFRSWRTRLGVATIPASRRGSRTLAQVFGASSYCCGFNPSASNCRLHSAGAWRSRSMLMPRGRRPSTAARTRSGTRKASEMVMLT